MIYTILVLCTGLYVANALFTYISYMTNDDFLVARKFAKKHGFLFVLSLARKRLDSIDKHKYDEILKDMVFFDRMAWGFYQKGNYVDSEHNPENFTSYTKSIRNKAIWHLISNFLGILLYASTAYALRFDPDNEKVYNVKSVNRKDNLNKIYK